MRNAAASHAPARVADFWEHLRASTRLKGGFLFLVVAALAVLGGSLPSREESVFADAERAAFDLQMRFLREYFPKPLANDVVLIGLDEQSEKSFEEPIALWHRHFARAFHALARAQPAAVGVDLVLPERSFDEILPGIDRDLMIGLFALKSKTVLVYVQTVNSAGELVPVQGNFRNIVRPENLGIDQQLRDPDSVSRRFSERALGVDGPVPTLAGQMLRGLGQPVGEGYIDYSVGDKLVRHVPMQDVVAWLDQGDEARLKATFGGRIVLVGGLVGSTDRWVLPVRLIELPDETRRSAGIGEAARRLTLSQPGVVIHLQVLRSHLANGLLVPVPEWLRWLLCAFAATAVLVQARPWRIVAGAIAFVLAVGAASLVAIRAGQVLLPLASIVICFLIALGVRLAFDAVEAFVERVRLQRSFAGQVSPAVMQEMLQGGLSPGLGGQLADICVLFSDVRGFTTLSENMSPTIVTTVLQRYFDGMVRAVHRYDGTVDKFIGDGMMVLFGAPRPSKEPCGDAVRCALAMLSELDQLNAQFADEGLPTLTIGIGVSFGSVIVGNIGSSERHNYSAIGDAVNVAARVEGLTKVLARKVLITESVISRIGEGFQFDALGEHELKGHTPVRIWGIRTVHPAPAAAKQRRST